MNTYTLRQGVFYVEEVTGEESEVILSIGREPDPPSFRKQIGRFKAGDMFWLKSQGIVRIAKIPVDCYGYANRRVAALVRTLDLAPDNRTSRVRLDRLAACQRPTPLDVSEWLSARAYSHYSVRVNLSRHIRRLVELGLATEEALGRYLESESPFL